MTSTEALEFSNAKKVSLRSITRSASTDATRKQIAQKGVPRKERSEHMYDNSEEKARFSNGRGVHWRVAGLRCLLYIHIGLAGLRISLGPRTAKKATNTAEEIG